MTEEKVSAYRELQMNWFCDGNSVSRFTSVYGPLYNVSCSTQSHTIILFILILVSHISGSRSARVQCVGAQ